mmetsp:Transcript_20827/g.29830  ORF Transcript_20827/g.29830 Transcript_20827/m.29830 type:complete len:518 (+) Transcript_20827:111-1664(+)|eukprot:CAMPEP_0201688442 /NCGR_PEP_ID=MMETSP0578-20130828/2194_1 /ASSEMBLY_ACC=CAM_ASM_000663 /TAXON_ID=267565 /ORGANISM="Skeletonema grethea, Strain CCMP 1804" /LENGTH=517 /DNA_ID=CAMNT_0048172759 /DNA_START=44 /DNA_END=1597 /DNA_ORIENTATION=-
MPASEVVRRKTARPSSRSAKSKVRTRTKKKNNGELRGLSIVCFVVFGVVLLALRVFILNNHSEHHGKDYERYVRAKTLRDALRLRGGNRQNQSQQQSMAENESRYFDPRQFPPLPSDPLERYDGYGPRRFRGMGDDEWVADAGSTQSIHGPKVDYTKHKYSYPEKMFEPPNDGSYPPLVDMSKIFEFWGQDDLDSPPDIIPEVLQHFDYQNPREVAAAEKYRDLELPFKVYNVPEVKNAGIKWTDEYVAANFNNENDDDTPGSIGTAQQSVDSFFAFYYPERWDVDLLGPSPSLDIEWTFDKWARHAVYADEVSLKSNEKHYYFQSGVPREERLQKRKHWSFVSRDLPSFSSPDPTFFGFNPPAQKGIQCRFGERGVTAATHYDGGRNMIAMMTGAKRYILSPPNACKKLGIVSARRHPSFRHSMLNFGRVTLLDKKDTAVKMSDREKEWLRIAGSAQTLSTVLKAGEVLYVPSHWFHYIVSLQKSAQCNTRSGIHEDGNPNFGGMRDVRMCTADDG